MEILLLGIYSFFVWLIFIKLKWLPWNTVSQVTVVVIPIVGLTAMILLLNIYAPSSHDVRVFKYTVPIVSQVRGRVIEVPIEEGNLLVNKGDVLFKVDPTPYQLTVNSLQAQLDRRRRRRRAIARAVGVRGRRHGGAARADRLARKRVEQNRQLAASGAGNRFDLEQAESDVQNLEAQPAPRSRTKHKFRRNWRPWSTATSRRSRRSRRISRTPMGPRADDDASRRANATSSIYSCAPAPSWPHCRWPGDDARRSGRPSGSALLPERAAQVAPGNEAEFTLLTYPGRIIKAKVDSVIWAQGVGQLPASGTLPMTGVLAQPPNRFAVKFDVDAKDRELFLAAGAAGGAAIYTEGCADAHHPQGDPARRRLHRLPDPEAALEPCDAKQDPRVAVRSARCRRAR